VLKFVLADESSHGNALGGNVSSEEGGATANSIVAMLMKLGGMRHGTDWADIVAAASRLAIQVSPPPLGAATATGGFPALPALRTLPTLVWRALAAAPDRLQRLDAWCVTPGGRMAAARGAPKSCAIRDVEWVCTSTDGGNFRPSEMGWRPARLRAGHPGLFLGTLPDGADAARNMHSCENCASTSRGQAAPQFAGADSRGVCPPGSPGHSAACSPASAVRCLSWRDVSGLTAAPCTLRSHVICAGSPAVPVGGCGCSQCPMPRAAQARRLEAPLGTGGDVAKPHEKHTGSARGCGGRPKRPRRAPLDTVRCLHAHDGVANCTPHVLFESVASLSRKMGLAQRHKVRDEHPARTFAVGVVPPSLHTHPAPSSIVRVIIHCDV